MGRKKKHMYVMPVLSVSAPLTVTDPSGRKRRWSKCWEKEDNGRCSLETKSKGRVIVLTDEDETNCREVLCYNVASFFQGLNLPSKLALSTSVPRGVSCASTLVLTWSTADYLKTVFDSSGNYESDHVAPYVARLGDVLTKPVEQRKVTLLMDVLLGSVAILLAGPSAFVRRGNNMVYPGVTDDGKTWSNRGTETYSGGIGYTGVSNFWAYHPVLLSLMTGLARTCLDFYGDGLFGKINDKLGLKGRRKKLITISKKKELSAYDRLVLRRTLGVFKPFVSTAKVRNYPGYYPLNQYTWSMLTQRLLRANLLEEKLNKGWEPANLYGEVQNGFYQWCLEQKPTKVFAKRGKGDWD